MSDAELLNDSLLPIMLNVRGLPILVVGGGAVATRKVLTMLACGADTISVVAPRLHAGLQSAVEAGQITYHNRGFAKADLTAARVVVVATDVPAVNAQVGDLCREMQRLCLRLDQAPAGDGILPATLRSGPIVASVATGDPATTRTLRDALQPVLDDHADVATDAATARQAAKRDLT